jgi:two-component system, NtrC family, nitrogen regulation sensor histidine kinase NtrY
LRRSFREMAEELEGSRARALEAAGIRAAVSLARGVAHELKNALTPLRLAVRALRTRSPTDPDHREALAIVDQESERLETLARAFSQFGKAPEGTPSQVDLVELLEYLTRTHLPPQVRGVVHADGGRCRVEGYYDALSRAFANVIINAVEALGEEGGDLQVTLLDRSGTVQVRIADSGPGIPPERLESVWDPDFTTKTRGTGLGLALVRQTIHAHSGTVNAANRSVGGAEITIILPSFSHAAASRAEAGSAAATPV